MTLILISGCIISIVGLLGLLTCIQKAIKLKRSELSKNQSTVEIKEQLERLYLLNMLSLGTSFVGLMFVVIGVIFDT